MLVNKPDLSEDEKKKLRDFTIHVDRAGSEDNRSRRLRPSRDDLKEDERPSRRSRYSDDRSCDNSLHRTRFADKDTKRRSLYSRDDANGSSKTNQHSNDNRRVRRGVKLNHSSSEEDDSDSSNNRHIRSRRSSYQDSDNNDLSGRRILMGGVMRK